MEEKRLMEESPISKVENSRVSRKRKGRKPGANKTGGRVKGTPNKKTANFAESLTAFGFCLEESISKLFKSTQSDSIKFQLIELVAKYKLSIPKPSEQNEDLPDTLDDATLTTQSTEDLLKVVK